MKRKRPYFRISIKGYYPEGSNAKLSLKVYTKSESLIGLLIIKYAGLKASFNKLKEPKL